MSKAALNEAGMSFARDLKRESYCMTVNILCPGDNEQEETDCLGQGPCPAHSVVTLLKADGYCKIED